MALIQKFLFETDFDRQPSRGTEGGKAKQAKKPPPPAFTEEQLAAAREEAFAAGKAAGIEEAEQASARLLAQAMEAVGGALREIDGRQAEANGEAARQAVRIAMTALRRLLPELERRHGLGEIEALLDECIAHLGQPARLSVRVHPDLAEDVRRHAEEAVRGCGFGGEVSVVGDPAMGLADCRIDWGDGGAARDRDRLWQEVERVLDRHIADAAAIPDSGEDGDAAEATGDDPASEAE